MHIAFVSLGAFGHVNPTLALVTQLVQKGVRVTYFSTEPFKNIVEPTGAKFVAVPSWMARQAGGQGGADENVATTVPFLFLNEAGAYIDPILEVLQRQARRHRPRLCRHRRHHRRRRPPHPQRDAVHQLSLQRHLLGGGRV